MFGPHITIEVYLAYKLTHLFNIHWWRHIYHDFYCLAYRADSFPRHPETHIYSISVCPKNDFLILNLSLFYLIFCSNCCNLFKWSDKPPLVIIKRSSIYALIKSNLQNIPFIFSWKMSGELRTPIGRCSHLYFPHGKIIVNTLIFWFLRRIL